MYYMENLYTGFLSEIKCVKGGQNLAMKNMWGGGEGKSIKHYRL